MRRSFAEATASSKSPFSSAPNRSSNDALALRRRVFLAGAAVLRVLRVVGLDGSEDGSEVAVFRVLRTGRFSDEGTVVLRVLRAGGELVSRLGVLGRALGPEG